MIVSVALNTPLSSIERFVPTLIPPKSDAEALGKVYSLREVQEATDPLVVRYFPELPVWVGNWSSALITTLLVTALLVNVIPEPASYSSTPKSTVTCESLSI